MNKEKRLVEIETYKLKRVKKVSQRSIEKQEKVVRNAMKNLQNVCTHTNIKETDAHDYHNNCPWTEQDCLDCGKYLGKY